MLTLRKSEKLQILLGSDPTTEAPVTVTYEEGQEGRKASATKNTISDATNAVDVLVGSGGGKKITGFTLHNADSGSITATVRFYAADGTTRIIRKCTLLTGETLGWEEGRGWYATDANGNVKTTSSAADSANISAALSAADSSALRASTALSTASSAGLAASVATSAATSQNLAQSTHISTALSTALSAAESAS